MVFFFPAEDGIRDWSVTGVQTCALPILAPYFHAAYLQAEREGYDAAVPLGTLDLGVDGGRSLVDIPIVGPCEAMRSEERRVGKEWRSGWSPWHSKSNKRTRHIRQ